MKKLTKDQILTTAKRKGGFFTVSRNAWRHRKLRERLNGMSNDNDCPLNYYSATQQQIIYSL